MARKAPTQRAYSMCLQHVQGEAGLEGKCSFIRADFHLNGAFQLNSLKLLVPPQNVSVSEQGSLGSFHFADRKRKSFEKTCGWFKSHQQPQTEPDVCGASFLSYLLPVGHSGYCSLYKTAQMLGLLNKLKC